MTWQALGSRGSTGAIHAIKLPERHQIEKAVGTLERWPEVSGVKPLSGEFAGMYRKRTGEYRLVFTVSGRGSQAELTIIKVALRRDVYE